MSLARSVVVDNSGVWIPALCPLLIFGETGELEVDDVADADWIEFVSWGGLTPSVEGSLIASKSVSSDPMYTVKARGGGETK